MGIAEPAIGREALERTISSWRKSFPDWHEEIDAIEATDNMVFARWTETGTFTNDIDDIKANGVAIKAAGMGWFRLLDGQIVEEWTIVDDWGTQLQIGGGYSDSVVDVSSKLQNIRRGGCKNAFLKNCALATG